MKIGLFFGTFNPIHIGHLLIAQAAINSGRMDKVWFVVSPNSPDKDYNKLLHEFDRYDLVFEAIRDNPDFKVLDVEFKLPKPSYTYLTIRKLKAEFPKYDFYLLVGSDNYKHLDKWKNIEELRQNVRFLIYPRYMEEGWKKEDELTLILDSPLINISSTFIRSLIKRNLSAKYLVPEDALKLIQKKGFYQ